MARLVHGTPKVLPCHVGGGRSSGLRPTPLSVLLPSNLGWSHLFPWNPCPRPRPGWGLRRTSRPRQGGGVRTSRPPFSSGGPPYLRTLCRIDLSCGVVRGPHLQVCLLVRIFDLVPRSESEPERRGSNDGGVPCRKTYKKKGCGKRSFDPMGRSLLLGGEFRVD